MQSIHGSTGPILSDGGESSMLVLCAAIACLIWSASVIFICSVGHVQIWRHYTRPPPSTSWAGENAPHVTIIRPLKGLEPRLYDCLASTFNQDYPNDRIHVRLCVSDRQDLSIAVVKQILKDFPGIDAKLLFEDEDEALRNENIELGPNPKIRNVSRAYREAIGDIIWAIDCNIWMPRGSLGRMVSKLEGRFDNHPWKIVHHLPIVEDIEASTTASESQALISAGASTEAQIATSNSSSTIIQQTADRTFWSIGGGRLEEQYLSSMHPKFYVAAYMLSVPAVVGKSVMYRRSHLNALTDSIGIDYFSNNICEDQLMGILMFKQKVPEERAGRKFGRQAICWGDIAVQPMANMSIGEYWSRRTRWFRVRKFTEFFPSLVEGGTESFICSIYIAFACTTLPFFQVLLGIPRTWTAFGLVWLLSVTIWCASDWHMYRILHSAATLNVDEESPSFARPPRRAFFQWWPQWIGREGLAFPIWLFAFWGGSAVEWRGKRFRVGMDSRVHEISPALKEDQVNAYVAVTNGKARND